MEAPVPPMSKLRENFISMERDDGGQSNLRGVLTSHFCQLWAMRQWKVTSPLWVFLQERNKSAKTETVNLMQKVTVRVKDMLGVY